MGKELGYRGSEHVEKGATIAEKILREISFPNDNIEKVMGAIRTHDVGVSLSERKSPEIKVRAHQFKHFIRKIYALVNQALNSWIGPPFCMPPNTRVQNPY